MTKFNPIFEIVRIKQEVRENHEATEVYKVRSPQDCGMLAVDLIGSEDREVLLVLCLNTKNDVVAIHRCHVGSLNSSIVHPREVFKSAILNNAASIIISHNHPSFNCSPSSEDIEVTKRIQEAGILLGIELLDHIIVAPNTFLSLKEKGYMN